MERDGLFFDPLQGEQPQSGMDTGNADRSPRPAVLEQDGPVSGDARQGTSGQGTPGQDVPGQDVPGLDGEPDVPIGTDRHRPDPEELQAQRQRERNRVEEDLKRMAQGFTVAVAPSRRERAGRITRSPA